jgi:hypothetical protein
LERRWSTGDDPRCLRRFSVDWFSERSGCQVVISVRHPAAVVSSLKRLGWTFDFEHRLRQPLLVASRLQRFRGETEAALRCPDDVIFQGSLLWRMIYSVVADLSAANHELCAVRQEDLSREPLARDSDLYSALNLRFSGRVRRRVAAASDAGNPKEVSLSDPFEMRLGRRAKLENWKRRLSCDEVSRVYALTEDVTSLYYADKDWEQ